MKTPHADEQTCRRYYEGHLARFRSPDLVEARHILLVADPHDAEALAIARKKAENAIGLLEHGPIASPTLHANSRPVRPPSKAAALDNYAGQ